jgi:pseudouridine kinase
VQLKDAQRDIKGVFHTTRDGIARLPAADVRTVDVTGAGDAFAATVCWSLYQGSDDLKLACRRGLKLAAGILDEIHDFNHDFNPPPLAAPARPKLFDQD